MQKLSRQVHLTADGEILLNNTIDEETRQKLLTPAGLQDLNREMLGGGGA